MRCNGATREQIDRQQDVAIRVHGFNRVQVGANPGAPPDRATWTYTIGLLENFDHPDLLATQFAPDRQAILTQAVGQTVVDEGQLDPSVLTDLDIELVPVHERHVSGNLVATWVNRYGRKPLQGEFLQIVPGPSWYCGEHSGHAELRRMDNPKPLSWLGY